MGIRFLCPNGHKLNVKAFQAGRRGICPFCGAKFQIPAESTLQPGQSPPTDDSPGAALAPSSPVSGEATAFEQNLETHVQQAEQATPGQSAGEPAAWSAQPTSPSAPAPVPTEQDRAVEAEPIEPEVAVSRSVPVETQPAAAATVEAPATESPPDPLTDTPNAVWYVRPPSGGQFGPAQADMMRGWLNEGRVSSETLVWREGWTDWQEAGSVFPQLRPASAAPEVPPVAATGGGDPTSSYRTGPRRRKNGPNIGLIVVLVAAVLLLLVVLVLIMVVGTTETPSEQGSSTPTLATPYRTSETPLVA